MRCPTPPISYNPNGWLSSSFLSWNRFKGWPASVKSAILRVIALAQFAMTYARGWAADSVNTRVRLKAELDQANQDNALLCEEMRIQPPRYGAVGKHGSIAVIEPRSHAE